MASDIALITNVGLDDGATDGATSTVGEPSVASADGQVFVTGNWYASRSIDDGATWTHVDPFTTLPSAAGGFCCDQLTLHDHSRGLWIWILQYIQENGSNVFRVAATTDGDFAGGTAWHWWDIAPAMLDPSWTDVWFDYPDAALSEDSLWVTFNVFDASGRWQRAAVMRFPLDTVESGGSLGFKSWSTTEHGSLRLTQGAQRTMYWASHTSLEQLRLFAWAEGDGPVDWWEVDVAAWSDSIESTAPNGVNWLGRADPRITGGWVADGTIGFAWTAGAGDGRPHPYCRIVRIDESTKRVADEPDLWSNERAWAYPATAPNGQGQVGLTAFHGGADRPPGHVVGARDDAAGNWVARYTSAGSDSPAEAAWGDYLSCRAHAPSSATWVAIGYTLEGGGNRRNIVPRVVHFTLDGGP